MTRHILALVLTALLLFSLTACSTVICKTDQCEIYKQGSKYYLKFAQKSASGSEGSASSSVREYNPTSTSIREMKQKVKSADFTTQEIETLRLHAKNDILEINRIDKWHEPVMPNDLNISLVTWYGESYSFQISSSIHGFIDIMNSSEYNDLFADEYTNYFERDTFEIISQETATARNATVTEFTTFAGRLKDIRYLLTLPTANIYVRESYWIQMDDPYMEESETVPIRVYLYGTASDGTHFYGSLTGFTERPTEEWLSQFSLREYIETEVS